MPDFTPLAFDHQPRTRIVFGPGVLGRLGSLARELGATCALIVTDRGIVAAGHACRATASLQEAGIRVLTDDGVRENPTTGDVDRCLAIARSAPIDLIVGIGGGSSMDTAKGANFLLTNGGAMRDYWGVGKATRPMLPLIAIPTTAGTGSECQSAALIADEVTHQKMACLDPKAAARIALLDPELTLSKPRFVTAVTGIDAIAHALETAVTRKRTAISSLYAREAFQLLFPALPAVLADPTHLDARSRMLLGAAYAGTAIELSMLGAAHAAANPLTAHFNIVHGAAVGLMLPAVIRFNATLPEAAATYADLAVAAGIAGPHVPQSIALAWLIEAVTALLRTAGIPTSLTAAGVDPNAIPELAAEAARQWTATFNPRSITAADFEALYRETCV
jgi:alcohol dehydrogenase